MFSKSLRRRLLGTLRDAGSLVQVRDIRSNLLRREDTCSLRHLGVLPLDDESDDEVTDAPTFVSAVKYHLFRPHRGEKEHHHRRKHHDVKAAKEGKETETVERLKEDPVGESATAHAIEVNAAHKR